MPVYTRSLDEDHPETYIANDLWRLFSFAELVEVMRQRRQAFYRYVKQSWVGKVDKLVEKSLKSRIICSSDLHYPKYALHVFAENVPLFNHSKVMLDRINGMSITIDAIPIDCGFSDSQIMAPRNCSISQTGGLSKTLTLTLKSKIILTTNINITDRLTNGQMWVFQYF